MAWLARNPARRADPSRVLLDAKTLLVLSKNYFQGPNPRVQPGRIARYAWGADYHEIMLKSMSPIEAFWFFIGVILTSLEFEPDLPVTNRCGRCTRCIDVCPTRAITQPYQLDAGRCISYLTIEHKGPIPIEFRSAMGDRIYGCDDCLEVCPWNRFAKHSRETKFQLSNQLKALTLRQLAVLTDDDFGALFRNSPIKRIKRARFVRNVCVALGNVGTREDLEVLNILSQDDDPLIAEHACWGVEQIRNRAV